MQNLLFASIVIITLACLGGKSWATGAMLVPLGIAFWQNAALSKQMKQVHQQADQEIRESKQHFYKVFDQAPSMMQLYAPDGTLRHTNQAWKTVWGDCDNLEGYNVLQDAQIIASGYLPYLQQVFSGEAVTSPPILYDPAINGHTDHSRWLEGSAYPIRNDAGEVQEVVLVAKDVTERSRVRDKRKQVALALQISKKRLRHVNEALGTKVVERTAELARSNSLLQATLEATTEGILVLDDQGKEVNFNARFVEMWGIPDSVAQALRRGQEASMVSLTLDQLEDPSAFLQVTGKMLSQLESETFDILELKNGRVFERYSYPQRMNNCCIGKVLSFRDVTDRKQAERALQLRSQQTTAAILIQQEIAAISPNLDEVMALIVDRVQELTRADGAVIEMVKNNELVYCATNGVAADVGLRLNVIKSLSEQYVETGEILYYEDTEADPRVDPAACRRMGIRSMVVVPLSQHSGNTTGVLKVFSATNNAFTEQSIQTLQLLAGFLTNTLRLASEFQAKENLLTDLQTSEERYHSVIAALAEGIVLQNADGTIGASNASAERILGLSAAQIRERSSLDPRWHTIHEDGSPFLGKQHPAMVTLRTGTPCRNVIMGVSKPDHQLTWISINTQPLFHSHEPLPYAVVASFSDITERQRVEEALRQSEAHNRAILQAVPDLLLRVRRDGFCLECIVPKGSQAESFLPISQDLAEVLPPELLKRQLQDIEQAITTGELQVREHSLIKQGKLVDEEVRTAAIDSNEALVIVRDISDRKQAEENLRESQQQLSLAFEGSGDGLWDWNFVTAEVYLSPRWLEMLGYVEGDLPRTLETATLEMWKDLIHPDDQPWVFDCLNAHLNDPTILYQFEYRVLTKSGEWKWIGNYGKVVAWNEAGQPTRMAGTHRDVNDRKQAEIALQHHSEVRYRAIVEDQTELITRYLADGTITFVNRAYALYFGRSPEELVGSHYQPVIFEADREQVTQLVTSMNADNPVAVIENRVIVDGEVRWTLWHNRMLVDEQGQFIEFQSVGRDITALKQTEARLFHEKELAQVTLRSIGDAVITTDATGRVEYLNPVAESLTRWTQSAAQGLPLVEVFRIVHETTREPVQNPVEEALQENKIVGLANHTVLIARNGHEIAIEDSAAPIHDREGQIIGAVMVFHDVTQTRTLSRQLTWQANHDALTGLVNRREFEGRVEQALTFAKLDSQVHALCYLDLDRFKIVNDTCGHVAGDELLRQVTTLLQKKIRKADTLARLGGDEFGVLLNQCTLEQALRVAHEMRECVQEFRFVWQEQIFAIGASIGLVGIDADSESLAEIISTADAACYTAKNRGRNRVYVAQTNDQERLQQRGEMQWVGRIAQALEHDRFCLYAQPIAALTSEAQNGDHYEVLLRLWDEQGNLVPPMAFIPAAERYNLMHLIDRWVIRTLFRGWLTDADGQQSVYAINLSGSSINDDQFIDFLYEQFTLYSVSPKRVCFEITETVAIANLTKASQFIQELQRIGCRFALDDFGAGMSSFAYLKSLPVDYLKIDGAFIRNIVENSVDDAIVSAITQIAKVMGIRTIAEFVENDAILERITAMGIDYAQGYGIAEPRPLGSWIE